MEPIWKLPAEQQLEKLEKLKLRYDNVKSNHPLFGTWGKMRGRCNCKTNKRYPEWGGRGITICDRWNSFWFFALDMGHKPSPKHSIDRIDNDGPYSPDNCRWATPYQQTINSSKPVFLEHGGKRLCLKDWAKELGVPYKRITKRYQEGWTVERILEAPRQKAESKEPPKKRYYTYQGQTLDMHEWSKITGIAAFTLNTRHLRGWPAERALTEKENKPKLYEYEGESLTLAAWARKKNIPPRTLSGRIERGLTFEQAIVYQKNV